MRLAAAIALVTLAACGGLETPDLRTGVVTGRISGAAAGGYVYPLGRPDLKVALAADGSFRLTAPSGTQSLVLYDGTFQQDATTGAVVSPGRAQRLDVQVEGADVRDVGDHPAAGLPLAGGVLAGVRAESGARCKDPRFTVEGTDHDEVVSSGAPAAFLAPLPAGDYPLTVSMNGFLPRTDPVHVVSGATTPYETELMVDDGEQVKGCVATSGCDSDGLRCEDDGRCHESGTGSVAACGATCSGGGCALGLSCQMGRCDAPMGCVEFLAALGSPCVSDDACKSAMVNGVCARPDDHTAGYCTVRCQGSVECQPLFGTDASCSNGYCGPHH